MKKYKKIGVILILTLVLISCMNVVSNAATTKKGSGLSVGDITKQAKNFVGEGEKNSVNVNATGLLEGVTSVASILTTIGGFALVIIAIILGIQFMTSPPQKQAVLRSQMIGLLWAAVVIFGAYGIWSIAVKIVETF